MAPWPGVVSAHLSTTNSFCALGLGALVALRGRVTPGPRLEIVSQVALSWAAFGSTPTVEPGLEAACLHLDVDVEEWGQSESACLVVVHEDDHHTHAFVLYGSDRLLVALVQLFVAMLD